MATKVCFRQRSSNFIPANVITKTLALLDGGETADADAASPSSASIDAMKNPTNKQISALIQSSSETATRRIVCERSSDIWRWPADRASHSEGARIVGAA